MTAPGNLTVVGLGPGDPRWLTPAASAALVAAQDLVGYHAYLDRVPAMSGQQRHGFDNRSELDRARLALDRASQGRRVAVVSGGDPGVFAMAAAVFEAVERRTAGVARARHPGRAGGHRDARRGGAGGGAAGQ